MQFDPSFANDQAIDPNVQASTGPITVSFDPDFQYGEPYTQNLGVPVIGPITGPITVSFDPDFQYGEPYCPNLESVTPITPVIPVSIFASFRAQPMFRQFADTTAYPDDTLEAFYGFATNYVSDVPQWFPNGLRPASQTLAIQLMMAHLITISNRIGLYGTNAGPSAGFVKSSRVKDVAYELEAPKAKSAFGQWLSQTPYGQQLYAMLNIAGAGGFYMGGSVDMRSIRKGGGRF